MATGNVGTRIGKELGAVDAPLVGKGEGTPDAAVRKSLNDATPNEWSESFRRWSESRQGHVHIAETSMAIAANLEVEASALDVQEGGDHYKHLAIQPMEYSMKNGLDACQHTAIKYITRFRDKGGIEDLRKAKHCIDLLIGFEPEGSAKEAAEDRLAALVQQVEAWQQTAEEAAVASTKAEAALIVSKAHEAEGKGV